MCSTSGIESCGENKQQILDGLDELILSVRDYTEANETIRDLKMVLNDAYCRVSRQPVPEATHQISMNKFRSFIDEIVNGTRMDCEYFPLASDRSYLVPADVITFLNRAVSKRRRDEAETKDREIRAMKAEHAALKAEFEKYKDHVEKRSVAQSASKMKLLVPSMSGPTQDGFIASASSEHKDGGGTYHAFKAFRDLGWKNEFWHAHPGANSWIQIQLPFADVSNILVIASRIDGYYGCSPTVFSIQASNDGTSFDTLLVVRTSWCQGEEKVIPFENEKPYLFYRIFIHSLQDNPGCSIRRLNFGHY